MRSNSMTKMGAIASALVFTMIVGSVAVTPSDALDLTGRNDISVTILNWYSDVADPNNDYNMSFRVSFDTNNDGMYEEIHTSGTFMNTTSLARPFEAHAFVPDTTPIIRIKVEVLETNNTIQVVNGSGPVHTVVNERNATEAWAYNNINSPGDARIPYYIYYAYRVTPVHQPDPVDAQPAARSGNITAPTILSTIWEGSVFIVAAALAPLAVIIWIGRRRSPPSG